MHDNDDRMLAPQLDITDNSFRVGGMFCPETPNLGFYTTLVQEYSRRKVNEKYPEDLFHAFSSIQTVLSKSYPGGFIQCIPLSLFTECLLWQTTQQAGLSRRSFGNSGMRAASWSWIGWSVPVNFSRVISGDVRRPCQSVVSWYASQERYSTRYPITVASTEAWKIRNKLSENKTLRLINSRVRDQETQRLQGLRSSSSESRVPFAPAAKTMCSFLHGRVLAAQFNVVRRHDHGDDLYVLLSRVGGYFAGVLIQGDASVPASLTTDRPITLLAVSTGTFEVNPLTWRRGNYHAEYLKDRYFDPVITEEARCEDESVVSGIKVKKEYVKDNKYEFYDALWVELEGGVAYRKGIARVAREAMEEDVSAGWVDITLG